MDMAMWILSGTEFVLWALLAFFFLRKNLGRRYPAMAAYLALHLLATPVLLSILWFQSTSAGQGTYPLYYYPYWAVYLASAVLIYFICVEVFRSSLAGFPGLMRFGIVIFRWIILASVIVTLTGAPLSHSNSAYFSIFCLNLMRTVSILELCLLAFLCLAINALRLKVRDLAFGLALGFGMLSANDFIISSLFTTYASHMAVLQLLNQVVTLASLSVWLAYFALPEPAQQPVVIPVNSTLYRWNEIASALGHTGTQVAVQQPANSFFLSDVEKVVETVLKRTLPATEAGSDGKSGQ